MHSHRSLAPRHEPGPAQQQTNQVAAVQDAIREMAEDPLGSSPGWGWGLPQAGPRREDPHRPGGDRVRVAGLQGVRRRRLRVGEAVADGEREQGGAGPVCRDQLITMIFLKN